MTEARCETAERLFASPYPHLKIKAGRMWRAVELFYGERLSTTAIAEELGVDEREVCELIEEAGWR